MRIMNTPQQTGQRCSQPKSDRHIIKAYKDALPTIFPDRFDENGEFEVPKDMVFAKTNSHADDIIKLFVKNWRRQ